jgi:hypothetical protein
MGIRRAWRSLQALIRRLASSRTGLGRTSAGSLFLGHRPALVLHFAAIETHSRPFGRGMGTSVMREADVDQTTADSCYL